MAKMLSDFVVGESGKILSVSGSGAIRRRLFDMGVTPGADVRLRLRKAEAACVELAVKEA